MDQSDDDNESQLQSALAQVERLSDARERERLIELCTALLERFPAEPILYYERAQAQNALRLKRAALHDMDKALERKPNDSRFLFFRGLWSLELGDYTTAVVDLTAIIELENESDPSGYCDTARFVRALAYIWLGQFDVAQRDLDNLEPAEDGMWVGDRVWTPAQMRQLVAKKRRPV